MVGAVSPATALVTGASGFIGSALIEELLASGHRVIAVTRDPGRQFPPDVEVRVADLADGLGMSNALFAGVGLLFHCAGEVKDAARMRQVHVDGTRRLVECLPNAPGAGEPRIHWVQLSSVGAYGPASPANRSRCVDEGSPERPVGEYETTKTASDRLVVQAAASGRISFTILRPANVIGRRMPNSSLRRVISMVKRGWFFEIDVPDAVANYVHVDDVVSALSTCASHPAAHGQTFNLSNDCLWRDLVREIASIAEVKPPRVMIPEALVRAVASVLGDRLDNPVTHARIDALVSSTRYPTAKIEQTLGFRHRRPMPGSIADLMGGGV
jgi:nucleoside-diphosphate-sugar epimerase